MESQMCDKSEVIFGFLIGDTKRRNFLRMRCQYRRLPLLTPSGWVEVEVEEPELFNWIINNINTEFFQP